MPLSEGHILTSEMLKCVYLSSDDIHRLFMVSTCSEMGAVVNILCA